MWVWTANESIQRSRTVNRCQIKNCKFKKRQRIKKRESERRRFVKRNKSLTLFADLKQWSRVFCSSLSAILHHSSSSFWLFKRPKQRHFTSIYIYIYIKRSGLSRVSPGQLPSGFLLRLGSVPGPGRLGPGSTRQAGSGFKTMVPLSTIQDRSFKKALFGGEPFFFLVLRERCVVQN
jgi:hypothetical protein